MRTQTISDAGRLHELRFVSLFDAGRGVAVPCDEQGCVDIDALSERLRISYFSARARMGRDFAYPVVQPVRAGRDTAEPAAAATRLLRGTY